MKGIVTKIRNKKRDDIDDNDEGRYRIAPAANSSSSSSNNIVNERKKNTKNEITTLKCQTKTKFVSVFVQ